MAVAAVVVVVAVHSQDRVVEVVSGMAEADSLVVVARSHEVEERHYRLDKVLAHSLVAVVDNTAARIGIVTVDKAAGSPRPSVADILQDFNALRVKTRF